MHICTYTLMHKLLSAHALINKYEQAGTLTHTKKSIEKYVPTVLKLLHTILYIQTGNNRVASRTSFYETNRADLEPCCLDFRSVSST